jgi:molybdopterin-guanine dinucleotide biosynthesis protein A
VWILARHDADVADYEPHAPEARILLDAAPAQGPVAALRQSLAACDAQWIHVLPVDCPAWRTPDARELLAIAKARRTVAYLQLETGPRYDVLAAPRTILSQRTRAAHRMKDVALPGIGLLRAHRPGWNVNTPGDLEGDP